jgi:hypothetical protein
MCKVVDFARPVLQGEIFADVEANPLSFRVLGSKHITFGCTAFKTVLTGFCVRGVGRQRRARVRNHRYSGIPSDLLHGNNVNPFLVGDAQQVFLRFVGCAHVQRVDSKVVFNH